MSSAHEHGNAGEIEASDSGIEQPVLAEMAFGRPATGSADHGASHKAYPQSRSSSEAERHIEDGVRDFEELRIAPSGQVYSVFSKNQKRYIVIMVTWAAFISPASASIYFPALNPLAAELNVSNTLINLTLTSYMIFQGLSPTIFGDFSDMAGRRPAYILAFIIYLGANIGLALQQSYVALFLLRCLQSTGSSGAIALGYGVVADVSSSAERGLYVGIVGVGTMMGPALAPVIGGVLAQFLGWRSIFWFLVIISGLFLVPFIISVPETGRNVVGNGSIPPQGWNMTLLDYVHFRKSVTSEDEQSQSAAVEDRRLHRSELAKHRRLRFPNPLKTVRIIMEKDVAVVLFYNAMIYTSFYDVIASVPSLFQEIYGFNDLQVGLCYLPFGAGCALASWINGILLDWNYRRVASKIGFTIDRKHGDNLRYFPIEHARLGIIWPLIITGEVGIICYGWALEKNAPLAAPLILLFIMGLSVNGAFNIMGTLLVDLYPQSPATATAANNLVRCFMGAGGTGIIDIMIASMGRGWCFTFIGLVCLSAMPMMWIEMKWGPRWREERMVRLEKEAKEENRRDAAREAASNSGAENTMTLSVLPLTEEKKDG